MARSFVIRNESNRTMLLYKRKSINLDMVVNKSNFEINESCHCLLHILICVIRIQNETESLRNEHGNNTKDKRGHSLILRVNLNIIISINMHWI